MVGKAQRTKNNVKASNSGRSAQLLASLPNTSFIGFSTLKDAALHTTPDLFDDSISPDFQIILKKMNKKDSVTKHKALNEFADLCSNSEVEALKSILPLWPRLYSILSIDIENRVREATQSAHKCIVTRVKRNIAPHLKHLIGPWIVSQFDTYPPAASIAKNSFEDVFPPLKRNEVFSFCKEDLFNYIIDNLIVQTPQTLSNPKITDAINMEMKYERVISSTLQAYALFVSKLSPDSVQPSVEEHNSNILSTAKFWKYQKHDSNLIRSSWYLLVSTFIDKLPQVFEADLKKLTVAIFSNLNEKDSKVNANVWDAALYCVLKYNAELWKCVSIDKLVVPNICSMLDNGFHGNATQVAPKLLPLLSRLPNDGERVKLVIIYEKILTSLLKNITATRLKTNASVQMNSSEFDAMVKCFVECCRYVMKMEISPEFRQSVVLDYLLPLYRIPTAHAQFSLCVRFLYQLEPNLQVIDTLWESLTEKLLDLEQVDNSLEKELCLHLSLLQCLWNPTSVRKSGGAMKVKFQDDKEGGGEEESEGSRDVEISSTTDKNNTPTCPEFLTHFQTLIVRLIQSYLSQLNTNNKTSYVLHICKLCSFLDTKSVYDLLPLPEAFPEWGLLLGDTIYELMCKYINKMEIDERSATVIIEQCSQNQTMSLFIWCLNNLDRYGKVLANWLRDEKLNDTLNSIVSQVMWGSRSHTEILIKCFVSVKGSLESKQSSNKNTIESDANASNTGESMKNNSNKANVNNIVDLIINRPIADKIFNQFIDVFSNFESNLDEDKIDYENCARVLCMFLKVEEVCRKHKDLICHFLGYVPPVILKRSVTQEMVLCWKAALACAQPSLLMKKDLYLSIHKSCLTSLHPPKDLDDSATTNINTEPVSEQDLFEKSTILLSELVVDSDRTSGIRWEIIARPKHSIDSTHELWHLYCCIFQSDVCSCQYSHRLVPSVEWNIHDNQYVQEFYWEYYVYVSLALNLIERAQKGTEQVDLESSSEGKLPNKEISQERSQSSSGSSEKMYQIPASNYSNPNDMNEFVLDYFLYSSFLEQYCPNANETETNQVHSRFSSLLKTYKDEFIKHVQSWDASKLNQHRYLRRVPCLKEHLLENVKLNQDDEKNVETIASAKDFIKLVNNIALLNSPSVKHSFIQFVRDNSKFSVYSRDVVALVTSMVQVFTKLLEIVNSDEEQTDKESLDALVDAIRGELMLCVTSHLVHYYTWITSQSLPNSDECGQIFLAAQIIHCWEQVEKYCKRRGDKAEFSIEWESVFAADCREVIVNIWVWTASMTSSQRRSVPSLLLLSLLGSSLTRCSSPFSSLSTVCPLLLSQSSTVQVTAYHLMTRFNVESYEVFAQTLTSAQTVVAAMLESFSLGDTCIVLPSTESFSYTIGYLLLWSLIVSKCDSADSSVRLEVSMWLKQEGYISALMRDLLRLMPDSLVHCVQCPNNVQNMFTSVPSLQVTDIWDSTKLSSLVSSIYYQVLRRFPALVRHWWNDVTPSESSLVEKFTAKYVSPLLCAEELKTASKFAQENMVIRVFPGTKEVIATYTLEEASMEITICLPSNHPLGVIRVDSSKNLFPNTQWIKQITKFLIHANGSICDGLISWKSNMDKKFEGVEECYICFCILHARNHELPRKSCRTCQKKFHSYCLFKWFTTSNKSTCPICRNLF
uniref:E3 ubiquitin-protein ligase listerin n=1 Tax=Cacopsylla melanoneura TaxID=428564 RepID=A0A8D9BRD6_9HEMI